MYCLVQPFNNSVQVLAPLILQWPTHWKQASATLTQQFFRHQNPFFAPMRTLLSVPIYPSTPRGHMYKYCYNIDHALSYNLAQNKELRLYIRFFTAQNQDVRWNWSYKVVVNGKSVSFASVSFSAIYVYPLSFHCIYDHRMHAMLSILAAHVLLYSSARIKEFGSCTVLRNRSLHPVPWKFLGRRDWMLFKSTIPLVKKALLLFKFAKTKRLRRFLCASDFLLMVLSSSCLQYLNWVVSHRLLNEMMALKKCKPRYSNAFTLFKAVHVLQISLCCPLSCVRMEYPGRGLACKHFQCFDVKVLSGCVMASWSCLALTNG